MISVFGILPLFMLIIVLTGSGMFGLVTVALMNLSLSVGVSSYYFADTSIEFQVPE